MRFDRAASGSFFEAEKKGEVRDLALQILEKR